MKQSRILIIDDSASIRRLLAHNLGKRFEVLVADNADHALELLEQGVIPDLAIVDVAMPGMDGFSLVERLKKDPSYSTIPIIMLTARDESADKEKGLKLGADDYLTKPFNTEDLADRIEHLLA
ncbi:MAG: response regulator [Prosthecochloris sp.]|uniref:response regulator transcription factor n=1 Tax=Prosthecochloris sp. TaxID=290513 RepID=UPI002588A83E|nr:response regulator [Prosthecochloris sp.]MCW8797895.1 response regulator [Prosthecochloris sp.]